jgi:hypothetical protein
VARDFFCNGLGPPTSLRVRSRETWIAARRCDLIEPALDLTVLVRAERGDGELRRWHYALGARDARDAWDATFQRYHDSGVWVLVHFKDVSSDAGARVVIGKYGRGAAAGQSPVPEHDLFLRDLWAADEAGIPVQQFDPPRSLWVAKSEIAELYFLESDGASAGPEPPGHPAKTG